MSATRQRTSFFSVALCCALSCGAVWGVALAQDDAAPQDAREGIAVESAAVPLPPGLPVSLLMTELDDEAAARLHVSTEDALAQVEPAVLADPNAAENPAALPPLALQELERAEALMRDGRSFDAIEGLLGTLRLAPEHPRVLRSLGLAYTRSGNHVRGEAYLRQAAALDAADTESRVVLTRLALDRRVWGEALALSMSIDAAAAQADTPRAAAQCFADFARARALDELGYARAAIAQYERVLASDAEADPDTAAGRELYIVRELAAQRHQRVGDLWLQLDEPAAALAAYQQAAPADTDDPAGLTARLVYIYLLQNQPTDAERAAVAFLASSAATEFDAPLIGYLVERGADPILLDAQLVAAQQDAAPGHFPLVAARAAVLPQARTIELIDNWLASQPDRLDTFRRAIALLRGGAAVKDDPRALAQALALTARAMHRQPQRADDYAQALLSLPIDPVELIRAMRRPEVAGTDDPMLLRLASSGYRAVGRGEDAYTTLARVLAQDPDDAEVQLAMVRLLIAMGGADRARYGQAADLLGPVDASDTRERFDLAIELHRRRYRPRPSEDITERQRYVMQREHNQQLALAQRMIRERLNLQPNDLDLLLLETQVQTESGEVQQAITTMAGLLDRFATREEVYTVGIRLYMLIPQGRRRTSDTDAYFDFYFETLVPRLQQMLPESYAARMTEVERMMLREDPMAAEALPILESLRETYPDSIAVLKHLIDAYALLGRPADEEAALLAWIALQPAGASRRLHRLDYLRDRGADERVAGLVRETFALDAEGVLPGGPLDGQIAMWLLGYLAQAVGDDAAEPDYLAQLARFPDNALLNNDLGYRWAVEGRNLLAAEAMIQRALDAEPQNASYLDSMAWVLYKMGRFEEAREYQANAIGRQRIEHRQAEPMPDKASEERAEQHRLASRAVLLDHMGDILYALGEVDRAREQWTTATLREIKPEFFAEGSDDAMVAVRCRAKVDALEAGLEPDVPEVPGEAGFGAPGHPADRD